MKRNLFKHPVLPYPIVMTKKVGNTKFAHKCLYCPGTYAVGHTSLSPEQYGIVRANHKH